MGLIGLIGCRVNRVDRVQGLGLRKILLLDLSILRHLKSQG